jgi:dephospho-CoA kinase
VIIAGLTGGIASGKSTVAAMLAEAGARIIDADKIAREVVAPGLPAFRDILARFGRGVLLPTGEIDRQRLGDIIFNDPAQKARLNAIVHPRVYRRTEAMIAEIAASEPDAVVVLDIPLLLETGIERNLSAVIVVYVPQDLQLRRLMARDRIDAGSALARIRSQMPIEEKRRLASVVIDNSGSLADTRRQALSVFSDLSRQRDSFSI